MRAAKLVEIRCLGVDGAPLRRRAISERRMHRAILGILCRTPLASIATVTPARRAHIHTAYFCYSERLELYFLSHPDSLHCRNAAENGTMAMAVFDSAQPWGELGRGLQLFGTCTTATGRRAEEAEQLYERRFPAYRRWVVGLPDDTKAREYRFFRFRVDAVKVLDEREFGDAVWVAARVAAPRR